MTPHESTAERRARGRRAREDAPRRGQGDWAPAAGRADPVGILERQAAERLPELVPIRYGRMATSPFAFFRGAAAIMAADLAATPRSGLTAQLCGDAHLANFGGYASPDRRLVFDLNDFDETLPGPWEWDLKRLAASVAVAGRDRGLGGRDRRAATTACVAAYREAMRGFAELRNLEIWYARLGEEQVLARLEGAVERGEAREIERGLANARRKDSRRALAKLTRRADGELRLASDPPLLVPVGELLPDIAATVVRDTIAGLLREYTATLRNEVRHVAESYRFADLARRVSGVGSVGTRAWVALLLGRDEEDPLVLQIKEARPSVLEEHLRRTQYGNRGRRIVEGQRLMQAASDVLLGWVRGAADETGARRDYYVRQLWDWKLSPAVETMPDAGLKPYVRMCGWTLARAHARSGDPVAIAAYLGRSDGFDGALARFAETYADANERDHRALLRAIRSGRVRAEHDV